MWSSPWLPLQEEAPELLEEPGEHWVEVGELEESLMSTVDLLLGARCTAWPPQVGREEGPLPWEPKAPWRPPGGQGCHPWPSCQAGVRE